MKIHNEMSTMSWKGKKKRIFVLIYLRPWKDHDNIRS